MPIANIPTNITPH